MILLDFSPIVIASVHMAQREVDTLNIDFVRHLALNSILMYRKQYHKVYGEMVICCDKGRSWRKDAFPFYKANRSKGRAESPLDWNMIFEAIDTVRSELDEFFPYKVVSVDGAEADDIIGALVKYSQDNELTGVFSEPQPMMIVSSDKDFRQLQKYSNVKQFSPILKKQISEANPQAYLIEQIVRGDGGDGVPNMMSDDDTFVMGKRQVPIRSTRVEEFLKLGRDACKNDEERRNFDRNKLMVDLDMMPESVFNSIIDTYHKANVADRSGLFNYFVSRKLKNLMKDINQF